MYRGKREEERERTWRRRGGGGAETCFWREEERLLDAQTTARNMVINCQKDVGNAGKVTVSHTKYSI